MRALISALCVATLSIGCSHTFYEVDPAEHPENGLPFYTVEQFDTKTLSYEEIFYEMKAIGKFLPAVDTAKKSNDKKTGHEAGSQDSAQGYTKTVVVYLRKSGDMTKVFQNYIHASNPVTAWASTAEALLAQAASTPSDFSLTLFPMASKPSLLGADPYNLIAITRARTQMPSAKKHHLQIHVPSGGSAQAEADLNADGTLGKSIGQKQDQLPVAIVSGVAQAASAVLGSTSLNTVASHFLAPAAVATAGNEKIAGVDLTITPIRRVYTVAISKPAPGGDRPDPGCDKAQWDALQDDFGPDSGCRLTLAVALKRGADLGSETKPDDGAVSFSGSVTLPKASAGSVGASSGK